MPKPSEPAGKTKAIEELESLGLFAKHVERPTTESDVQRIVNHANREGLTVWPLGGGTALGSAPLPADLDIALDMTGMDDALAFIPMDLTMTARAGMTIDALNEFLAAQEKGYILPLDPPQSDRATLGGVYASRSSGPLRHRYGTLRDQILGVGAIDAQGRRVGFGGQTVKNVAGFDLTKFFMGSAGRLCVVTKVSFHIHPLPEAASLCEIFFQDEKALRDVLSDLQASVLIPSAVVVTHPPGGGNGTFRMLTAFEGHPKDVERQNRELLQLGQRVNGSGKIHWGREAMVKGLRSATDPKSMHTLRFKVCVPMVQGPSAYCALEQLAKDLGVKTDIALIAGSGVLYVYALDEKADTFLRLTQGVRKIALGHDGHVFLIKAPRKVMSSWGPWIDPTMSHHVFEPIKKMLDPKDVFPPLM